MKECNNQNIFTIDEGNRLKLLRQKQSSKVKWLSQKEFEEIEYLQRKKAEEEENPGSREGFKFDKASLEKLQEQRLPTELLLQLENMIGEKYSNEEEFIERVELILGNDLTLKHRPLLLKYARYKKRNRKAKVPKIKI